MSNKTSTPKFDPVIALNRKARHDYFIEDTYVAGLALEGWEVKSLRLGRAQISESHVIIRHNEIWMIGSQIVPISTISTHKVADPNRTRKLLMQRREIEKLIGNVERKGYTIVPLKLFWEKNLVKLEIGLAKGKKQYDKREAMKERDWGREKARLLKTSRQT